MGRIHPRRQDPLFGGLTAKPCTAVGVLWWWWEGPGKKLHTKRDSAPTQLNSLHKHNLLGNSHLSVSDYRVTEGHTRAIIILHYEDQDMKPVPPRRLDSSGDF